MLSEKMNQALNEQIKKEFFSAYLYLQMSVAFDKMGLKVFSAYYRKHAEEEQAHGLKLLDYVLEAGGDVVLLPIPEPTAEYDSADQILEITLSHERGVTESINELAALAESESDRATRSFLNWYIDEQVEEEATAAELLQIARLAGPAMIFAVESRVARMMG